MRGLKAHEGGCLEYTQGGIVRVVHILDVDKLWVKFIVVDRNVTPYPPRDYS